LPPSESHDEFLELCATATTGSLSPLERGKLREHLSLCESCREIMTQYHAIVDRVIPGLAPDATEEKSSSSGWSPEQAEAKLFTRLKESDGFSDGRKFGPTPARQEASAPTKVPASPPMRCGVTCGGSSQPSSCSLPPWD
jgi:hypothetical protein